MPATASGPARGEGKREWQHKIPADNEKAGQFKKNCPAYQQKVSTYIIINRTAITIKMSPANNSTFLLAIVLEFGPPK